MLRVSGGSRGLYGGARQDLDLPLPGVPAADGGVFGAQARFPHVQVTAIDGRPSMRAEATAAGPSLLCAMRFDRLLGAGRGAVPGRRRGGRVSLIRCSHPRFIRSMSDAASVGEGAGVGGRAPRLRLFRSGGQAFPSRGDVEGRIFGSESFFRLHKREHGTDSDPELTELAGSDVCNTIDLKTRRAASGLLLRRDRR